MKTDAQVRQKIKQVLFRYRKKFVREGLAKAPENCSFNVSVRYPFHAGGRTLRVCRYVDAKGEWNNVVCDRAFGGVRTAEGCPHFRCSNTSESLKEVFRERWQTEPVEIGEIAKAFPDVAALMWAMAPCSEKTDVLTFFEGEEGDGV